MQQPQQTHKAQNHLRIFVILVLAVLGIFSLALILKYQLYIFIIGIIACLTGLLFIRFPFLYVYHDCFTIENKFFFNLFSEQTVYKYDEIEKIWFSKGFAIRVNIIALLISVGDSGSTSKADQMVIKMKNGDKEIINRFGKRDNFIRIIEKLNSQCSNEEELQS